ncbi:MULTISPECIES: hypothetical protein [unclassified Lysobacter]|uniref:hypothetical protein n=1 Tax=unclassified Lysobacter TaxID=2635362 RepID=UPI0006F5D06F|nr:MULTISPECIES: hypothetical protein [unclassified Lysobacter]KRA20321.1 hypothetical protein ASD69_02975 [Lysobacter sp. Root604]KRD39332.1 hypothetical protein ASE35_02950 [Lysobacter sp. Root916]KRD74524.1 hypothetical protein ASE43_14875 [Lysobacter sp. Root983]SFK71244.1 hypothetical protein SAMN04487938_1705 [Lysobacter sp. cf310]
MSIEFIVAIADNTANRTIVEGNDVRLSGGGGTLNGKVLIRILPSGVGAANIRLHIRSPGPWWALDDVRDLQRFSPLVETAVLAVERLS